MIRYKFSLEARVRTRTRTLTYSYSYFEYSFEIEYNTVYPPHTVRVLVSKPMKRRRTVRPSIAGGAVKASPYTAESPNANTNSTFNSSASATNLNSSVVANLPKIPGVPFEAVPIFLHALKTTAKFFQTSKTTKKSFTAVDWEKLDNSGNSNVTASSRGIGTGIIGSAANNNENANVHDAIMNRMKAASSNASTLTPTTSEKDDKEREIKFIRAVNNWMKDVRFLATRKRNHQQQQQNTTTTASANDQEKEPPPIPYSMFLYLWELHQEHKRISVRRSALFLSGLLLQRSKDCRFYLDQEKNLADWVSSIAVDGDFYANTNSNQRTILQLSLLQKEAIALISHLLDKGYGSIYAKLGVAAKSLKHRCCPTVAVGAASAFGIGIANRRNLRDVALRYGRKEIQKVEKLLVVAEELLLILVPRFVPRITDQKETTATSRICENDSCANPNTNAAKTDGSDNDDSDIDWEDGGDESDGDHKNDDKTDATKLSSGDDGNQNHEKELHHLSAVERTMVAMEKTSGTTIFSGGNLEIDFDRRAEDGDYEGNGNNNSSNNTNNVHGAGIGMFNTANNLPVVSKDTLAARKKIQEIAQKISDKHLVRLSAWLDGLRNSDGLVARAVNENEHDELSAASLVSLSSEKNALRLELIAKLSVLKQEISRVLSSTSRLLLPNVEQQVGRQSQRQQEESAVHVDARSAPTIDQNSNAGDNVSLPLNGIMGFVAGAGTWTSFGKPSQKRKTNSTQQRQRYRRRIEINYNTNRNKK